jgi:hypothetical protein
MQEIIQKTAMIFTFSDKNFLSSQKSKNILTKFLFYIIIKTNRNIMIRGADKLIG